MDSGHDRADLRRSRPRTQISDHKIGSGTPKQVRGVATVPPLDDHFAYRFPSHWIVRTRGPLFGRHDAWDVLARRLEWPHSDPGLLEPADTDTTSGRIKPIPFHIP